VGAGGWGATLKYIIAVAIGITNYLNLRKYTSHHDKIDLFFFI